MILIIYCHPSKHSRHCSKILKHVTETLEEAQQTYHVLDLYRQDFNGHLTAAEYERMVSGERVTDPDVKEAQGKISAASALIFIYPTWWYGMPGRLKGFVDRVFTTGFAYRFRKTHHWQEFAAWLLSFIPGIRYFLQPYSALGLLKKKKTLIFRTFGGPKFGKRIFGNTTAELEEGVLRFCGITDITVHEYFNVNNKERRSQEAEDKYMAKVEKLCRDLS
ncbi:MAG: NAD(P)H-dependent oxidoreductase [bacterium]|nr:NAD(P)H-dependent oxidoreductase [bacterium]